MRHAADVVAGLQREIEAVLRPLLAEGPVTALVDFPNYPNVGDSAIYLGQLAILRSLGIPAPRFICDFRTYDRRALARAVGDGIILLTGGGSFGDLWPTAQECREDILRAFPRHRVIQLPQTLHFSSAGVLDRARRVVNDHQRFVLLVRDHRSLEMARREFAGEVRLCPDMAFALGMLRRAGPPSQRAVWLSRSDKERAISPRPDAETVVADWLDEPSTLLRRTNYALMGATLRLPPRALWRRLLIATYRPLARQRLERGMALLSAGDVIITDRLHGHILALLLGIPHVLLDDANGKLSSFHETWTYDVSGVRLARDAVEALDLATRTRTQSTAGFATA